MPDERFIHKRLGHSEKINALTDLEFRVWTQYQLSADDCGVMRHAAVAVQADNDSLAARPAKTIQKAIDRLVSIGLLLGFEHQGRTYVCQGDWNTFQKVRFPRATVHPAPPVEVLLKCCEETRELFRKRHGATPEIVPKSYGSSSDVSQTLPHAGTREEANGQRLTAEGSDRSAGFSVKAPNGSKPAHMPLDPSDDPALSERAGRFCERYADLHEKYRNGALYMPKPNLDFIEALQIVRVWKDDARLDKLVQAFMVTDDEWIASGSRSIPRFRSRASWCDERLREAGL